MIDARTIDDAVDVIAVALALGDIPTYCLRFVKGNVERARYLRGAGSRNDELRDVVALVFDAVGIGWGITYIGRARLEYLRINAASTYRIIISLVTVSSIIRLKHEELSIGGAVVEPGTYLDDYASPVVSIVIRCRYRFVERIVLAIMLPSAQIRGTRFNRILVVSQDKRIGALTPPPALKRNGVLVNVISAAFSFVVPNRYDSLVANLNSVAPYGVEGQVGFHRYFGAGSILGIRLRRIGIRAPAKELVVRERHVPGDRRRAPRLVGVDRVRLDGVLERYVSGVAVFIDDLLGVVGVVRVVDQPIRCRRHNIYRGGIARATVPRRNRGHAGLMSRHETALINLRHALVRRRPGDARPIGRGSRSQLTLLAQSNLKRIFDDVYGRSWRYLNRNCLLFLVPRTTPSPVFMLQSNGSLRNPFNSNGVAFGIREFYPILS